MNPVTGDGAKPQWRVYLALHILMLVYSMAPVCMKQAGRYPTFSLYFCLFFALSILILGAYALLWQQILKRLQLTTAYANKAVTVVWGLVWGIVLFGEVITLKKCIGIAIVLAGVILYSLSEHAGKEAPHA
ncbi:MAG: EamA family transporter [Ruminococcaceae bacterium]|nr:EamA family transporter [Oscillospiraceae bacterium]